MRSGPQAGTCFRMEILGTNSIISVTAEGIFAMVLGELTVMCARGNDTPLKAVEIPSGYCRATSLALPPHVVNVAETYAMIAADLKNQTAHAADIDSGVELQRLLSAVAQSAASGQRVRVD
jgi:predicted dehydrogenase